MTKHIASLAIGGLLLVGVTHSWAGPGDIDTSFGSGGRVDLLNEISLILPDDRVVVAYNAGNLIVARLDANGQVDRTYGEGGPTYSGGGETRVPLPGTWPRFYASYASPTPDGGLLFAGSLRNFELDVFVEAVLRLDRNGHLVTSFGGQGDGYYRLTAAPVRPDHLGQTTLTGMAVDANGRVILARRSWTADGRCGGPTSVVRLTPSGMPDAAFGTNGRADVPGVDLCGGAALFGARSDGSVVVGARGAIVGLDATGALDWAFGIGGYVSHGLPNEWGRGVLLPDGGILIVERDISSALSDAALTKFDRSGQLDPAFGASNGSVRIDLGPAFFGISGARYRVREFVLTPDAMSVYLRLEVLEPDGSTACAGGIARVSLDGTPDLHFGTQGLTCLDYSATWFSLITVQRNGSPLLSQQPGSLGGLYRLLVDATPSPGMLMMVGSGYYGRRGVGEADGTVSVQVERTAGRDGAVSVSFATGPRFPDEGDGFSGYDATPGSDFQAAAGRLDWADGDDVQREITVTILDDDVSEPVERFSVGISDPQGGAFALEKDIYLDYQARVEVAIIDDDEAVAPPGPTPGGHPVPPIGTGTGTGTGSGGGGSLSWETLLVLSGLLIALRRRPRRRAPGAEREPGFGADAVVEYSQERLCAPQG